METLLNCEYETCKSFYGKAKVKTEGKKTILVSYFTEVAYIVGDKAVVTNTYSNTTLKHIKEFLKQNGFKAESKKQILEDYKEMA